jgi:NAD(P)-dependent dehydrogenase (short-subunit alcohol dehydrogenase family)
MRTAQIALDKRDQSIHYAVRLTQMQGFASHLRHFCVGRRSMSNIVITGSTKGIGLGLAKEFRKLGHSVVITSRGLAAVDAAMSEVRTISSPGRVIGLPCDVSQQAQVQALWDAAQAELGSVDIWINNAGLTGPKLNLPSLSRSDIEPVIAANFWGMIWGTKIPLAGMTAQGSGKIFNFEGFGSDGMTAPGLTIYGSTKAALTYFTKSMNKEIKGSPVLLGTISPGIVVTDLLEESKDRDPAAWEKTKRLYNILADRVETVVPYLAAEVLKANKPGTAIKWLTTPKAAWRFMSAGLTKRKVMPD